MPERDENFFLVSFVKKTNIKQRKTARTPPIFSDSMKPLSSEQSGDKKHGHKVLKISRISITIIPHKVNEKLRLLFSIGKTEKKRRKIYGKYVPCTNGKTAVKQVVCFLASLTRCVFAFVFSCSQPESFIRNNFSFEIKTEIKRNGNL
jgi:hypothetical protein